MTPRFLFRPVRRVPMTALALAILLAAGIGPLGCASRTSEEGGLAGAPDAPLDPDQGVQGRGTPDDAASQIQTRGTSSMRAIHLKSVNGQYVVAEQAGGGAVNANRPKALGWETFDLIDHNGGPLRSGDRVSLRTNDGRHYVAAEHNGGGAVNAHGTRAGPWETFTIFRLSGTPLWGWQAEIKTGHKVSFRTNDKRHYLGAEGGGGGVVNAHGPKALEWETFTLEFVASSRPPITTTKPKRKPIPAPKQPPTTTTTKPRPPIATTTKPKPRPPIATTTKPKPRPPIATTTKPRRRPIPAPKQLPTTTTTKPTPPPTASSERRIHLRSVDGQYVVAEQAGGGAVNANRAQALGWETFALIDHNGGALRSGDKVSLQTSDGRHYVAAEHDGGGAVNAHGTRAGPWETFRIFRLSGNPLWGSRAKIKIGDKVALRTNDGRHYLGAEHGGGGVVNAHGTKASEWETFTLELAGDKIVSALPEVTEPVVESAQPADEHFSTESADRPSRWPAPRPPVLGIPRDRPPTSENRCLDDVSAAFAHVDPHGERLAFWTNGWRQAPDQKVVGFAEMTDIPEAKKASHMQGIARLNFGPYLVVSGPSRAGNPGHLYIAALATRGSSSRFRSNRILSNDPRQADRIVNRVDMDILAGSGPMFSQLGGGDQSAVIDASQHGYHHASGLQAIGDYVAVGLGQGDPQRVAFYDLSKPNEPRKLPYELLVPRANSVGIAKRPDGRYLLVVRDDTKTLYFFRSRTSDLERPDFEVYASGYGYRWRAEQLLPADEEWRNYQNINLVSQCDGRLFLIGFHHKWGKTGKTIPNPLKGSDWAELFELTLLPDSIGITKLDSKLILCKDACSYHSAGGAYVTEDGQLLLYGVDNFVYGEKIRANENRMVPTQPISAIEDAWVEVFKGKEFSLDAEGKVRRRWKFRKVLAALVLGPSVGPSPSGYLSGVAYVAVDTRIERWRDKQNDSILLVDYADHGLRQYWRYSDMKLGFNNEISSVRWQIPSGWSYRLFKKNLYKGESLELVGTGRVEEFPDLGDQAFNNDASSSKFLKTSITAREDGWVELYAKKDFLGRRLRLEGSPRAIANFASLTVEDKQGFDDVVSSIRYQLPRGSRYRLYQRRNFGGAVLSLEGNGGVTEWSSLSDGGWNNRVSSSR